jgi:hemerythrin-like metal-binding protein
LSGRQYSHPAGRHRAGRIDETIRPTGTGYKEKIMGHIVWTDAFSVGVEELNYQHMQLIGMINRLTDLSALKKSDQAAINAAFNNVLNDMVQYAAIHFDTEERYLKTIGYFDFDKHVEEHTEFTGKTAELKQKATAGELDISGTTQYLQKWLSGHILVSDMDYRKFKERRA